MKLIVVKYNVPVSNNGKTFSLDLEDEASVFQTSSYLHEIFQIPMSTIYQKRSERGLMVLKLIQNHAGDTCGSPQNLNT